METKKGNLVWKVLIIAMCGIILLGLGKPATDNVKDLLGNKDSQTEESVESPGESAVTGSDNNESEEIERNTFTLIIKSNNESTFGTYTVVEGMTWGEFLASKYNTDNFEECEYHKNHEICVNENHLYLYGETYVQASDVIDPSGAYYFYWVSHNEVGGAN